MLQQQITPLGPPPGTLGLPEGWRTQWSAEHQQVYYSNIITGESVWTIPSTLAYPIHHQEVQTQSIPSYQEGSKDHIIQQEDQAQSSQLQADLAENIQQMNISSHLDQERKILQREQILPTQLNQPESIQPLSIQKENNDTPVTGQEVLVKQVQKSEIPLPSVQPQPNPPSSQDIAAQNQQREQNIIESTPWQQSPDKTARSQQISAQPTHETAAQQQPIPVNHINRQQYSPHRFQQHPISLQQDDATLQFTSPQPQPQPQLSQQQQNSPQNFQQQPVPTQHQQTWTSPVSLHQPVQVRQIQQQHPQSAQRKQSVQRKPVGGQAAQTATTKQQLYPANEEKEVDFRTPSASPNQSYQRPLTNTINHGDYPTSPEIQQTQPQQSQYFAPLPPSHSQQHHPLTPSQSPHSPQQQSKTVQYTPPGTSQTTSPYQTYSTQYPPPATPHSSIPQQQFSQTQQYPSVPIPGAYQQPSHRHFSAPEVSYQQQQQQAQGHFSPYPAQSQQYPVPPASTLPQIHQQSYPQSHPQQNQSPLGARHYTPPVVPFPPPPQRPTNQAITNPNAQYLPKPRPQSQLFSKPNFKINSSSNSSSSSSGGGMMTKFSSKLTTMRKTIGPGSTASPVVKWGSRAALGLGAIGAMALGVDCMDGGLFDEGASVGDMGGGGDLGGGDLGGGDIQGVSDASTALDANYAENSMALQGQENALQLLDPPGTTYETVLV